jgi:hypothetical protein
MTVNLEIGNFSGLTILTGAGWTHNWGGRLAVELWQDLIGHKDVQSNPRVRELLLEENCFEAALGKVQEAPFTPTDRVVFEHALLDAFLAMDREIARVNRDRWINIYKVQDLLSRFWGQRGQNVDTAYLFTLNQDLWLERNFYNQYVSGAPSATLPGLQKRPNQQWFTPDIGPYREAFVVQPLADPAAHTNPRGCFNVVKLHGSFN